MLESLVPDVGEFPQNMKELLRAPKTLMLFLAGVAVLI
jgi:hypothetical protein